MNKLDMIFIINSLQDKFVIYVVYFTHFFLWQNGLVDLDWSFYGVKCKSLIGFV
jgi:hypothetical protein